ncbi:MAG TPA: dihydrofolate reductase family protein [Solirubrobacterales bacterium]|nr:dihydrofolate reductase family protein [Solirubrobacterales bacterium]
MSRIVNSTYITLDGAIENPQDWPSGRHEDDGRAQEVQLQLLLESETVLMGRRTYEGFAPVWSAQSGDPFSDKINSMEKLVASTTLSDPEWNNTTVVAEDLVEEIGRRKGSGGDIVQYGFGPVTRTLLDAGLLDEVRLWVHPLMVGAGEPSDLLFRAGTSAQLELTDVDRLASGIVILTYAV